jgi:hypothetical protein
LNVLDRKIVILAGIFLLAAASSSAGVKVEEDEVIFSLKAPDAGKVFLVGDFNNWNPTVDMMMKEGERFTATMFLMPGKYRYKFVVDGRWIVDPDNPPADPDKGSLLHLIERGGALMIKSEEVSPGGGKNPFTVTGRSIGVGAIDDGREISDHEADVYVGAKGKIIESRIAIKTHDESWRLDDFDPEFIIDRGFLTAKASGGTLTGFDNYAVFTSRDPFHLFGGVGPYRYGFGLGMRGLALKQKLARISFVAVYADRRGGRADAAPKVSREDVAAFDSSAAKEVILRAGSRSLGDEDVMGGEVVLDTGTFVLGYGRRKNMGMQRGLIAALAKKDSTMRGTIFGVHENWSAQTLSMKMRLAFGISLKAGYGWSRASFEKTARDSVMLATPTALSLSADAEPTAIEECFQKSRRVHVSLFRREKRRFFSLEFERSRFDYYAPVYERSRAVIKRVRLDSEFESRGWSLALSLSYLQQDYGRTPGVFHYFSPVENYWLDYDDVLTVENMVGFDMREYGTLGVAVVKKGGAGAGETFPFPYTDELRIETGGVLGEAEGKRLQHVFLRARCDRPLRGKIYAQFDGRLASYPGGDGTRTFVDPYVELGWRSNRLEISLGFGLDPVMFDPATNEYGDIGRLEYLRAEARRFPSRVKAGGTSGGQGKGVKSYLIDAETELQEKNMLKLEWIVLF